MTCLMSIAGNQLHRTLYTVVISISGQENGGLDIVPWGTYEMVNIPRDVIDLGIPGLHSS